MIKHLSYKWLLVLLLVFSNSAIYSQVIRCGTVEFEAERRQQLQGMQTDEEFETWLSEKITEKRALEAQGLIINGVYQIPVVVHVVHNGEAVGTGTNISYAAIQSQIDVLNEDFRRIIGTNGYNTHPDGADTEIEFCLARRKPDGTGFANGEDGVNRINRNTAGFTAPPYAQTYINGTIKPYCTVTQGWDPGKYMNFWSMNLGNGLLGYAQFPTSVIGGMGCGAQSGNTDGVVMLYSSIGKSAVTGFPAPYNEGRTATHEIGHWLGLRHIWGDALNCTGDDFCNDTPMTSQSNAGCPVGTNTCTTTPIDAPDMIENYMDYTYDACMNIFTKDQKMRMRTVLENSPIRASLIRSDACIPPAVSDASIVNVINPKGDNCVGSITPQVTLRNRGSSNLTSAVIRYTIDNANEVTFNWTGNVAQGAQVNVTLPAFTTTLGIHTFRAQSYQPNGVTDPHTEFDASEITFAISNGYEPGYSQDFDGGTFPPDVRWRVDNPNTDCYAWVGGVATSSTGVLNNACAMMTNYQNGTNADEYLYTPVFQLPCGSTNARLTFDVAYRRRVNTVNDRLRVEISTDCGATWQATSIFDKAGATLATSTTLTNSYWIPSAAADWRNESVSLQSFVQATSRTVQFRFRATNAGNGGNLYLDNVNFLATQPVEIDVLVDGNDVLDEGFYSFGASTIGAPTTKTFTVTNTGSSNLTLNNPITISGGSQFVLGTTFGSLTVPAGGSTTFTVVFTPNGVGPYTANLSFTNNDCDEGTYNFQLQGSGLTVPPVADFSADKVVICAGDAITFTSSSLHAASWNWTFVGGTPSAASTEGPHTITYNTPGTYAVSLVATNAFGTDTETKTAYITVSSNTGSTLPLTEGFVGTAFPPADWSITNGGNQSVTWVRSANRGTAPSVGNSAYVNFYNTDTSGEMEDLNLPAVNLAGMTSSTMTFDVAYARYNNTITDQLDVLVSYDCGETYTVVYSKSGAALATMANQTTAFSNPTTWRNESIDLTPFVGNSKVDIKIRAISGYGQYLYIDNVNVTGVQATVTSDFSVSATNVCAGESVSVTNSSVGATSWNWNFGAGATPATATGVGPHAVTYATGGTKTITLSVNGGAATSTQTVVVNAPSTPVVTVANNCGNSVLTTTGTGLLWSNGQTTPSITVTNAGTYTVTQTVNGCTSTAGSGVAAPTAVPSTPVVIVANNCGNSLLTTTGTGLLWSNGQTTPSITITNAGTYTVTQTVNGCTSTAGSGVAAPKAIPNAPVVTVSNNCGNSVLTTTGTGLLWSNGQTTPSITITNAGTYTVTQTVNGCTSTAGSGVAAPKAIPNAPVVTVSNNCGNSVLTTTGTGLLWSNGQTTPSITVTNAGTYTVTQTVNGCTSTAGSGVAAPTTAPSTPIVTVSNNCGNSVLTTTGTGLMWSNGQTTPSITVTNAGTYTVTQTVNGCTSTAGSGVAAPTAVPSTPVVIVANNCGNSLLTTTGTGLLWSNGQTTPSITVTNAGTYTVTQTVNGCTSTAGSGVAAPTAVPSTPVVIVANNCGNSLLTTTGTGLLWSNGQTTPSITVTNAGTYTVTQTVNGCTSTAGSGVAAPTAIPTAPVVTISNNCGNSVLATTGTGLLWSNGQTTPSITVTNAGTYTVTQTINGCTSTAGSGVAAPTAIPSTPVVTVANNCGNSVLTTTGTGLLWSNGQTTPSITVTNAGTYTVTQTVNGCTSTAGSGVADPNGGPAAPIVTVSDNCGESVLTATGTGLLWSNGETTSTITVIAAGTYTVTQTVGGCTSSIGLGVAAPTAIPTAPVVTVANNCGESVLTTTGTGLLWSNGQTTSSITVASAGTYTVTQTVDGCTSAAGTGVAAPSNTPNAPVVSIVDNCGSSSITATGTNLSWSTGETTSTIVVTTTGTFYVSQTIDGCTSPTASIQSAPKEIPSVTFANPGVMCDYHSPLTLSTGNPAGGTYSGTGVTAGQFNPAISGLGSHLLTYSYEAANGCVGTAQAVVEVSACLGIDDKETVFKIYPNPAFGSFKIQTTELITSIQIFDNTGRLVQEIGQSTSELIEINVVDLMDGIYHVVSTTTSGKRVDKLEIKK